MATGSGAVTIVVNGAGAGAAPIYGAGNKTLGAVTGTGHGRTDTYGINAFLTLSISLSDVVLSESREAFIDLDDRRVGDLVLVESEG